MTPPLQRAPHGPDDVRGASALWYWINERHAIYLRRAAAPDAPPALWTVDPVFRTFRFCNVFRELDRTTVWIRTHWREPYADHPNLGFSMAVARMIGWQGTLAEIGFPDTWDPARVREQMLARQARGDKLYTGAYMLRGGQHYHDHANDKSRFTCYSVLDPVYRAGVLHTEPMRSLQSAWEALVAFYGWGPFLAYEVVTDLRHTRYLRNAPDIYTWANPGPGAKRGLNRIAGRPAERGLRPTVALDEMRQLLDIANGANSPLADWVPRPLELRDIEHSLCETDKYLRALTGEGRPKALFTPTKEPRQ